MIEFDGVWKKFRYGEVHSRLRDAIPALVGRAFGRRNAADALWSGEFWALQDVSFAVRPGEGGDEIAQGGMRLALAELLVEAARLEDDVGHQMLSANLGSRRRNSFGTSVTMSRAMAAL